MPTGKGASKAFRMATGVCKKRGFTDFSDGTPGAACRSKLAEKIAAQKKSGK